MHCEAQAGRCCIVAGLEGLDDVLRDLELAEEQIEEAMDSIAKETAIEILNLAVNNVNGPDTRNLVNLDLPYPVGVITGTLKRSLKIKKLGPHRYKVFADANVANYAFWVHNGTKKMEARPFLDDAYAYVIDSKKYLEIADKILEDILDRR